MNRYLLGLILIFGGSASLKAQVKIGDNPNTINANSLLELESTNKGFLPPRIALNSLSSVAPLTGVVTAGMLIYSFGGILPDGYYYWNGTAWLSLSTSTTKRNNFILVKTVADLPAAVAGVINLVSGTMYEINGTIILTDMINLNGCVIKGQDVLNDKLVYTGASELFTGANLGTVNKLTLSATVGKVFNLNPANAIKNLIVRECVFIGSNTIGTVQNVGGSIIFEDDVYFNTTNGITFQNDFNVLLCNVLWNASNFNTYEKFIGSFNCIQILGGVRAVTLANTATALNISGITSLVGGSVKTVMFINTGTYVTGSFNDFWEVESFGLNTEKDDVASANIYQSTAVTTTFTAMVTPTKVLGTTTAVSLFRVTSPFSNRLTYTGAKTRRFVAICALTATQTSNNKFYSFFIAKNGVIMPESRQEMKIINSTDQGTITLACTVSMAPTDYIEVWVQNETSTTAVLVQTLNLAIK